MPYRRIVVGTDGSARAERAVREAAELAATAQASLVIVTARAPGDDLDTGHCVAVARDAGVDDVTTVSEDGAPAEVLLRVAEQHGADLLVVGSRGMTDASRFVIGSVANTISHNAACDVLIVHTEGD